MCQGAKDSFLLCWECRYGYPRGKRFDASHLGSLTRFKPDQLAERRYFGLAKSTAEDKVLDQFGVERAKKNARRSGHSFEPSWSLITAEQQQWSDGSLLART